MTFQTRLGAIFLVSAFPIFLFADGVTMSSSCSLTNHDGSVSPTTVSQVNPVGGCSVSLPFPLLPISGTASALANVQLNLPTAGQPAAPVGASTHATIDVHPAGGAGGPVVQDGSAQMSLSIDFLFTTAGPVRAGFLQLTRPPFQIVTIAKSGPDGPDAQNVTLDVGSYFGNFTKSSNQSDGNSSNFGPGGLLPFTLGENFDFHEGLTWQAISASSFGILPSAFADIDFNFTLFEADGVTPVQIALATPEPASWWFVACGCFCLLAFGRRRRTLVPTPEPG